MQKRILDRPFYRHEKFVNLKLKHYPVFIPYNLDFDTSSGRIRYGLTENATTLKLIDRDISLALDNYVNISSFKTVEAYVWTYDDVPLKGNKSIKFKFQVILATDRLNTFAILNYDRLDLNSHGPVGFSEGSVCKQFTKSLDRRDLTRTSNVGRPGKHVYLLTVEGPIDDCPHVTGNYSMLCWYKLSYTISKHI